MAARLASLTAFGSTATTLWKAGADLPSRARLIGLRARRGGGEARPRHVTVSVAPLGGETVEVRSGTHDVYAFSDAYVVFQQLPPPDALSRPMEQILELGTNVGYGLSELAHRYPRARLLGVEADPENATLAERNTRAWADRATVVAAAVWDSDTELTIDYGDSHGFHVRERVAGDGPELPVIPAFSVQTLLDRHMPEGRIDYVLLSAERSERRVLTSANDWLQRVDAIKVETYKQGDYPPEATVADLERAGFRAWLEPDPVERPWGGFAFGVRDR